MAKKAATVAGKWLITEMELWDSDYLNIEVRAYIHFESEGKGEFQFGLVTGVMDCEQTERDGKPAVEFSWEGRDEMDPVNGRGWAVLKDAKTLKGRIFFHQGDASGFGSFSCSQKDPALDIA